MHVAIIMDGNGRWAERRGLRRAAGHRAGARAVSRVVEAAVRSGVDILTLYAFSSDNWSRPAAEVETLMRLLKRHLQSEAARCVENGVRVGVIGRRDRLSRELVRIIERTEQITAGGGRLTMQLAIDYSARDAIMRAANVLARDSANGADTPLGEHIDEVPGPGLPQRADEAGQGPVSRFAERIARATHSPVHNAPVDLLIRTGGERRLSDFLLWECAYAELVFVDDCWPDFDEWAFNRALEEFCRRERRFGGLPGGLQGRLVGDAN